MIKVSIVDDRATIRDGLAALINGTSGFRCLHTYSNCESMLNHIKQAPPDVLLMDFELPGITGVEGTIRLKKILPNVNVVMLTIYEENELILNALYAGAIGYLAKTTPPAKLLESIQMAYEGGSPMSANIARKIVNVMQQQNRAEEKTETFDLSPKEKDILQKLSMGSTYESIAADLFISVSTVKYHLRKIYEKLQASSRSEAISNAIRHKLI